MSNRYKYTLDPSAGRKIIGGDTAPHNTIIANSVKVTVGDYVMHDADGFLVLATATNAVFGVVTGVASGAGIPVDLDSATTDEYTVAADNETVDKKYAIVDVSVDSIYSADLDAAAGTNTGSDLPGYYFDLADEDQVDESSASATTGTLYSLGEDPDDDDNVLVKINESELYGASSAA